MIDDEIVIVDIYYIDANSAIIQINLQNKRRVVLICINNSNFIFQTN